MRASTNLVRRNSSPRASKPTGRPFLAPLSCAALLSLLAIGCSGGPGSAGDPVPPAPSPVASNGNASPGTTPAAGGSAAAPGTDGSASTPASDSEPSVTDDEATSGGRAYVESVEVLLLKSFPLQVRVAIAGQLSDACTRLGEPRVRRDGSTFHVELPTTREPGMCAQMLVPFEETVALEVHGLAKETYTVEVDGKTAQFTFERDNELVRQ